MTTKLQAIREKCIEANPDVGACTRCGLKMGAIGFPECYVNGNQVSVSHDMGRTIRLADVLLAIDHHCSDWMDEEGEAIAITQHGGIWELKDAAVENNWTDYPYAAHYDLHNDNVENQSPEFIEFLYNLLCV